MVFNARRVFMKYRLWKNMANNMIIKYFQEAGKEVTQAVYKLIMW